MFCAIINLNPFAGSFSFWSADNLRVQFEKEKVAFKIL